MCNMWLSSTFLGVTAPSEGVSKIINDIKHIRPNTNFVLD